MDAEPWFVLRNSRSFHRGRSIANAQTDRSSGHRLWTSESLPRTPVMLVSDEMPPSEGSPMRVAASVDVAQRGDGALLIRHGNQRVALAGLLAGTQQLAMMWAGHGRPASAALRGAAAQLGHDTSEFDRLVSYFVSHRWAHQRARSVQAVGTGQRPAAELPAIRQAASPSPVATTRLHVRVDGLPPLGLAIANALIQPGAVPGCPDLTVTVKDPALISREVMAELPHLYAGAVAGETRQSHASRIVAAQLAARPGGPTPDHTVHAVITVTDGALPAADGAVLVARGMAHLPVRADGASVTVGPWVIPGVTACTNCESLHAEEYREGSRPGPEPDRPAGSGGPADLSGRAHPQGQDDAKLPGQGDAKLHGQGDTSPCSIQEPDAPVSVSLPTMLIAAGVVLWQMPLLRLPVSTLAEHPGVRCGPGGRLQPWRRASHPACGCLSMVAMAGTS